MLSTRTKISCLNRSQMIYNPIRISTLRHYRATQMVWMNRRSNIYNNSNSNRNRLPIISSKYKIKINLIKLTLRIFNILDKWLWIRSQGKWIIWLEMVKLTQAGRHRISDSPANLALNQLQILLRRTTRRFRLLNSKIKDSTLIKACNRIWILQTRQAPNWTPTRTTGTG